jgi:RHS repeat-associated protein
MQIAFNYDCTPHFVQSCILNRSRPTGKERDTESGLDHFQFRSYASTMGRWTSPDPGWFLAADLANPQTWNEYAYVTNNPLIMVDPLGLCGGAAPTASSKLGDVINAIGNFFCNVFGGGGSGGSTAGTGGGGTSGGTTSNTPPPNMRLVPVMSQNEGGILHNVWRLTTFPGAGVVSGDHNVSEHIAVKRNGTVPDGQGGIPHATLTITNLMTDWDAP